VSGLLLLEQGLNGLQFGLMLFLLAAGLTLVFGIMDMINLAHGSLYMIGAYLTATLTGAIGSFWPALPVALVATAAIGMVLEMTALRQLYRRDHLSQVLATFAILLIANDAPDLGRSTHPVEPAGQTLRRGAPVARVGLPGVSPGHYRGGNRGRRISLLAYRQNPRRHVDTRGGLES
jgi:branched-chain amino acid transport system permease protein